MSAPNVKRFKRCQWYYQTVSDGIWHCEEEEGHGDVHREFISKWASDTPGAFTSITKTGKRTRLKSKRVS